MTAPSNTLALSEGEPILWLDPNEQPAVIPNRVKTLGEQYARFSMPLYGPDTLEALRRDLRNAGHTICHWMDEYRAELKRGAALQRELAEARERESTFIARFWPNGLGPKDLGEVVVFIEEERRCDRELFDALRARADRLARENAELRRRFNRLRGGYADQAKFADHEPAAYFREFVRRVDAALAPVAEQKEVG